MKRFKSVLIIPLVVLLVGCGSNYAPGIETVGSSYATNDFAMSKAYDSTAYIEEDFGSYSSSDSSISEADIVKNTMMIVKTASLSVDVANLEEFQTSLEEVVAKYSGYFEEANINSYDYEYQESRYGYFTVRIPKDSLDEFLTYMDGNTSITSKSVSAEDVSLEYVDIEAKITALEREKKKLSEFMDNATEMSDLVEIESRLSEVQYELDSYNSRKRLLEGRVDYSTVYLTAHEERTIEHPLRRAFTVNFKDRFIDGMETTVEFFIGLVIAIPMIIGITAFVVLFIWLLRKVLKKVFKKELSYKYVLMPVAIDNTTVAKDVVDDKDNKLQSDTDNK